MLAIAQLPYGKTVAGAGIKEVMRDVVAECLAVAKLADSMPSQYSSTAQDLARGKRSEIDYLNGLIVQRGEALGIATPANRVLWALVKLMEGSGCRVIAGDITSEHAFTNCPRGCSVPKAVLQDALPIFWSA